MKILAVLLLLLPAPSILCQLVADECFDSPTVMPSFPGTVEIGNFDSDMLQWNGTTWDGQWPNAQVNTPPPNNQVGCRALWIGNATSWTTGGEGFALWLDAPLVQGQSYSFTFEYVSAGFGSDGAFAPAILTNSSVSMSGATEMGNLDPVGSVWEINSFNFVATAMQDGHQWLIVSTAPDASSGLISSWCEQCSTIVEEDCSFDLGEDINLCPGDSALLYAQVEDVSFIWQDGSDGDSLYVSEAGTYWLQVSSNKCLYIDSVEVSLYDVLIDAGEDLALCPNDTISLEATGGLTYQWMPIDSSGASVWVHPDESTTYFVSGTDSLGCAATDSVLVTVHPEIEVELLGLEQELYCLEDVEYDLMGNPAGGFFQGAGVAGSVFNPSVAGLGNHMINYTFEDGFGCKHESSVEVQVEICDFINGHVESVDIYPNPASTELFIKFTDSTSRQIWLTDSRGRLVYQSTSLDNTHRIPTDQLASGLYFLRIDSNHSWRVVVAR